MADATAEDTDREQRTFEPIPISAQAARKFVTDKLRQRGATNTVIGDYALAISELATNVIEHGDGSRLLVAIDATNPLWWDVEVVGGASSAARRDVFQPDNWAVAGSERASGRGLGIVRHLMDHVVADTTGGRVSIRCLRQRAPAQ